MQHKDHLVSYCLIRNEEIAELNNVLEKHFDNEYQFKDSFPEVVVMYPNTSKLVRAKVLSVKAPLYSDAGIIVHTDEKEYGADGYTFEVGYFGMLFGGINNILDLLPEPMKQYCFRWDGGNLPRRHEWFSFPYKEDAMSAARKFKKEHHISKLTVWEITPCNKELFASSIVGSVDD